ncbi:uncharacterized protein LOC117921066 isoform X7 [Vitis riparia]|uniref:uncharacterized protein LOC117921066 isoform X7 n=1 Tax=Vitis riparia TaxID=96939 RepID=UPI00155AA438|nr:uncharacterized protein LOC117921066 isoform X7 [Vitis riparia]
MKESKCLGAAVNLELCSLFPFFFFRRPHERTINIGVAGSILAISCCGGSLFIYPKFSSRSLYQRFMEEITGDDLQIEALPVGSIASDSAVTALLYWQGKLFVGCADRIIKVYSGQ